MAEMDQTANQDCVVDRRSPSDELLVDCRLRAVTELFAHTWDPLLLAGLRAAPRRRVELLDAVGGISDKVLTDALRRLLANGLIERRRYRAAPPHVEYRLSALGMSLVNGPLHELGRWILSHGDDLLEAQERGRGTLAPFPRRW